ncbi:permease-like cell division protein FtsX [Okibacterium fritillariae]|uniref:Cell division protein FtsX n=1 Tax=Okibacterium fritillariae TaxID=123320 RepID=A0A1T5J3N8_9MICO|nr:permease-like cell division protein FtsX [Okibacterium fritillariae]SKC45941.1 cell division protein FtsX [Okibacterium fritillariae]
MRFGLIWQEATTGLRRNVSMVISVVLVTFISLTFVGTAVLMQMQIGQMKNYWYDKAQVAIYLCTADSTDETCTGGEATDDQKASVETDLTSPAIAPFVDKFYFEDHQQAYDNFQEQFKDNDLAQLVTPEQLNETYWVNLKDPSQSAVLSEAFSSKQGVQSVTDQRQYLDSIFQALNVASYTAIGIAGLMLIAAVLLIATTIRLSAYSRRKEIGIMRLVGASNRFIQTPFVLEGVFAAVIGSLLAGGAILAIVHFFVDGYLAPSAQFVNFVGLQDAFIVIPLLIVVGVVLAALSANFAIKRYLKI